MPAHRRQDDPISFERVFAEYKGYVYRLALAMLGDPTEAEDAVQEIFLRVYRALDRYDPRRAKLSTWLYRIAVNYCRSRLRRRQVRLRFLQKAQEEAQRTSRTASAHWKEALLWSERRQTLWQGINRLKEPHRTVLILHYYLDMPASEIASVLNIREGTVYSRLHTARRRLREWLKEQGVSLGG